jgi:type IV pilus assembly protein PilE
METIAMKLEVKPVTASANVARAGRSVRRVRGFTLIELMITVAVVAILAAIAIPSYQNQVRKSRRAQAKADLVELAQVMERFRTVNNTYSGTVPGVFDQSPRDGTAQYTIALTDQASGTFTLTATPTSTSGQDRDSCGTLALNQANARTSNGASDPSCF